MSDYISYARNQNVTLHPDCTGLPFDKISWIAQLNDGSLMTLDTIPSVDDEGKKTWTPCISTSADEGNTWTEPVEISVAPNTSPHWLAECRLMVQTKSGVLVMLYEDMTNEFWEWDSATRLPSAKSRIDVWACRSTDGGKTWNGFMRLVDGWCGALIDIKQLSTGRIVATAMDMLYKHGRHICFTCVSDDDGLTWQRGNHLDLGGSGHHDGAMEPTFVELSSGRVFMLIRTNFDRFWKAYSDDGGKNWRILDPSDIDASSSPGFLLRLASGRIALVWNRLCAEGESVPVRLENGADFAEVELSWYREELSIAFSSDDARSWSDPVVIARSAAGQIAYPYMLEPKPGEVWVISRAPAGGPVNIKLDESKFV